MLSFSVCRFLFFIFLGSAALIRIANSDENEGFGRSFFSRDEDRRFNTLRQLFPMEDGSVDAMKSLIYDGNIQKVVNILQNNVKQWSFIESQLLEPNVNVGMPEIFIPLKHLTTTLELLGNVFISRNEYSLARGCLERACPLMELLPADVLENDSKDDLQAVLSSARSKNKKSVPSKGAADSNPYAASCFSLLREVYLNLYEKGGAMASSISSQVAEQFDKIYSEPKPSVVFVPVDHQINKKLSTSASVVMTTDGLDPSKRPEKLQSLRMSKSNTMSNLVQAMKSVDEAVAQQTAGGETERDSESDSGPLSALKERSNRDRWMEALNRDWISKKIDELRLPYDHLRGGASSSSSSSDPEDLEALRQLLKQSNSGPAGSSGSQHSFILKQKLNQQLLDGLDADGAEDSLSDRTIRSILFGDSEYEETSDKQPPPAAASTAKKSKKTSTSSGSSPSAASSSSSRVSGGNVASTSLIASDLEDMLRKFVSGDKAVKAAVIKRARAYYDELDLHYPEMPYAEYASNMDLGQVFIDVMVHIAEEGVGYIGNELLSWSESNGGIREVDQDFFDSILLSDRNRLLVLSAFDVAVSSGGGENSEDALMDIFNIFDIATASTGSSSSSSSSSAELLQRASSASSSSRKKKSNGGENGGSKSKNKKKKTSSSTSAQTSSGAAAVDQETAQTAAAPSSGTSSSATLNRLEREVTAALYEEFLGNVDVAALRSSVPMLNADNDWTLFMFYLVVIVSVVIVMQLLYADAQKKRTRVRANRSQKRPVSGVAVIDNILHYFQADEAAEGMTAEGGVALPSQGGLSSSSNPTTAAAADALMSVGTLLLYAYRLALWILSSLFQLLLAAANAGLSRVSPPAPAAPSKGKAAAKPVEAATPLHGLVELMKQVSSSHKTTGKSVDLQGSVTGVSTASVPSAATSSVPHSSSTDGLTPSEDLALKSRLSEAALDNELAATFAEPSAQNSSHKQGKKQLSFSSNLISPSVHVAAKNGVPITVKKGSAMKQQQQQPVPASNGLSNGKTVNGTATHSEENAAPPKSNSASTDASGLVVSKIAGKTIPLSSLMQQQSSGTGGEGGEFITVNKEKRDKKDKTQRPSPPIVLPPAFNNIRISSNTNTGIKRTAVDHSTGIAEERKASSLPNTPLNSSGVGGFFTEPSATASLRSTVTSNTSLPPPPPLRTVNKVSPDIKGVSASSSSGSLSSIAPLHLLPPAKTTSALQSLDYSLLSQSAPYSNHGGALGGSTGISFGLPASELVDFSSNVFAPSATSKPFVAPPPGMGSASASLFGTNSTNSSITTTAASSSHVFDQWSSSAKSSLYLDDFDFDDGVLQAADAFLDGLSDYVQSPVAPRPNVVPAPPVSLPISSIASSGSVFSGNTATAVQSLTPPRSVKPSSRSQSTAESSITIEAMYDGLSPDAPSFQPGKMYSTAKLQSTSLSYSNYSSNVTAGGVAATGGADASLDALYDNSLYAEDLYDNLMSDLDGALMDPADE